jgi:thiamine phosphate synthase YjbQ (UPF0047 family)
LPPGVQVVNSRGVKVFQQERQFTTAGGLHVTDITEDVRNIVEESGILDGICCVY